MDHRKENKKGEREREIYPEAGGIKIANKKTQFRQYPGDSQTRLGLSFLVFNCFYDRVLKITQMGKKDWVAYLHTH